MENRFTQPGRFLPAVSLFLVGVFLFYANPALVLAEDGATEALRLRYHAERAIARERAQGRSRMADAMQEALPNLLQEYLATRDGSIATDSVDVAYVQEQVKTARALEEPGVALALDVFSGPGTGYENDLRTSIAGLADFHEKADRAARMSEKTLDVHERVMEQQLAKVEQQAQKVSVAIERMEAKRDAVIERMEFKGEPFKQIPARFEPAVQEKALEKVTKAAEKVELQAKQAEQKVEQITEKIEQKAEPPIEKAEQPVEQITEKVEQEVAQGVANGTPKVQLEALRKGK